MDTSVRAAAPEDYDLFVDFFGDLGVPEPPPTRELWAALHMPTTFFLERGGQAAGYARYDTLGHVGFIRHIVTHRELRGCGVGRALMSVLAERLRAAGCTHQRLSVRVDNAQALALYESCGLRVLFPVTVLDLPWRCVPLTGRSGRRVVPRRVRDAAPFEDEGLERRFDQPLGRLALARRAPGTRVVVVEQGECGSAVALAVLDPQIPRCFPLRAEDVEALDLLLSSLAPLPRSRSAIEHRVPFIRLAIEDHRALAQELLARGGTLVFDLLHLSGPLPAAHPEQLR